MAVAIRIPAFRHQWRLSSTDGNDQSLREDLKPSFGIRPGGTVAATEDDLSRSAFFSFSAFSALLPLSVLG
jgi:hypothetical protein